MQDWLATLLIGLGVGFGLGVWAGVAIQGKLLNPLIGDKYEINKPKVKGKGNNMLLEQENEDYDNREESETKPSKFRKLINKFKRNDNK